MTTDQEGDAAGEGGQQQPLGVVLGRGFAVTEISHSFGVFIGKHFGITLDNIYGTKVAQNSYSVLALTDNQK